MSSAAAEPLAALWLHFMSNHNALSSPLGTSLWKEGLEKLNRVSVFSFMKPTNELSPSELESFDLLTLLQDDDKKDFDIVGDTVVTWASSTYRRIRDLGKNANISFEFIEEPEADFEPWSSKITLGSRFFERHEDRVKVPFYSINHEIAHLIFFRPFYSDLPLSDKELKTILLLAEWFCISLDLIIARDLMRHDLNDCFRELSSITPHKEFFSLFAKDDNSINEIASRFRDCLVHGAKDEVVEQMISHQTIRRHQLYVDQSLIPRCREIPTTIQRQEVLELMRQLLNAPFTRIVADLMDRADGK